MISSFSFYLFLLITIVNTYFLYFYEGFAPAKDESVWAFVTIFMLALTGLMSLIYHISNKRGVKKTMLRLSLIVLFILFVASLITRAIESFDVYYYVLWRWSQTILYGILFISLLQVAHNFYEKLKKLVKNQENYIEN